MHLWIVTIGSSDVQLDSDRSNKEKGRSENKRSDKIWQYWYTDDLKTEHYDIPFEPKAMFKDKEEPYRIAPRILGTVFQSSSEEVKDEIWNYLTFPLLDNFVKALEEYPTPGAIAIILTDQSVIFQDERQRGIKSPYWQDTCELKLILERYFAERFSEILPEWINLVPVSAGQSLDNWDTVLELVRQQFCSLTVRGEKTEVAPDEYVYVSHQAGTPAISSAVQFISLAIFGDRVKFLVSNEYNQELTDVLPSSNYLIALKRQQAVKLLEQHDYYAVKDIYSKYLSADENILLEAAIQWNFAKFDEFVNELQRLSEQPLAKEVKNRSQQWWWTAYEAAWLGVVRLNQGNTVEAMFHSFRSLEGLAIEYASKKGLRRYGRKVFEYFRSQNQRQWREHPFITTLVDLDSQTNDPTIRNDILDRRNNLFHQLSGFTPKDLFDAWGVTKDDWHSVLIECLNLISGQSFVSLQETSLMAKVHKNLKSAIDRPPIIP
ncbi:MAG TPA: hypothetical protein ACFE0H_13175 [Elainellaceae cyanobacterium]